MRKKRMIRAAVILLLIVLTYAAAAPIRRPRNSAGSWMARLEDERTLQTLSIPGTHDSGALYSFAGLFGKCQTLKIPQQLEAGVRFFDLRVRLVDNELRIYHNFVEQKASFEEVMDALSGYLRQNPSEFLIVSLKEEDEPIRSDKPFAQTLEAVLLRYPDVVSLSDTLPETVGSARGKMHILARYEGGEIGVMCGAGWVNNAAFQMNGFYVQDHYKLESAEEKKPDIEKAFSAAAGGKYDLVLNYTSCYLSHGFPPSYAGRPAHTINAWLPERIREAEGPLGVVICDFITSELSMEIIGRNFS